MIEEVKLSTAKSQKEVCSNKDCSGDVCLEVSAVSTTKTFKGWMSSEIERKQPDSYRNACLLNSSSVSISFNFFVTGCIKQFCK